MSARDRLELMLLAAIWGGSFLFMRVAAPEISPAAVAFLRVALASAVLLPLLAWHGQLHHLGQHAGAIGWVGLINSALPFLAYAYAAQSITAGLLSIFNATTPLWGAVIAWVWLRDKPSPRRALGLAVGFTGVLWLAWNKAGIKPGAPVDSTTWAVLACVGATFCYGLAANHTQRYLSGVPPLAMAAGSQAAASLALLGPAALSWPQAWPSTPALLSVLLLGLLCTAAAYVLFFRLVAHAGPTKAVTVTFLVPAFAMAWGAAFLGEAVTPVMALACGGILLGTGLVTGVIGPRRPALAAAAPLRGPDGPGDRR
ncbi:MAG: DMT family transporter [Rubrivivax sp.]|jgi:drug/metabolite transporter (DMT)-like permease|nr:DMT family transporter [Rubrivivax sp.]